MMQLMTLEFGANMLLREELPVALETAGAEETASAMRLVGTREYARAAEFLKAAREEVEEVLDPQQFRRVEEFLFWAEAALWAAAVEDESAFKFLAQRYKNAVQAWWDSSLMH